MRRVTRSRRRAFLALIAASVAGSGSATNLPAGLDAVASAHESLGDVLRGTGRQTVILDDCPRCKKGMLIMACSRAMYCETCRVELRALSNKSADARWRQSHLDTEREKNRIASARNRAKRKANLERVSA